MLNDQLSQPLLSVVVPVYNGGESFRKCLNSLDLWSQQAEVIVVSDGESDGSWQVAEAYGAKVIRLPVSKGPANARNIGAGAASSDIILFIDADVEIHPETIEQVCHAFEDSSVAALIGSYDDEPGAQNFLSQYKNLFHHYTHQQGREEASTFWGACGAIRKDIFLKVGGFDAGYRQPCIEDIELGYRLRQAGYRIRLCKSIYVKHLKHWTAFSLLRAEIFYRALPWMALLLKLRQTHPHQYRQFSSDLNLKWSSRLSVLLVAGLCLCLLFSVFGLVTGLVAGLTVSKLAVWGALLCVLALLTINWSVYKFFYYRRGVFFALCVIPWHWLYYFYSGLAFVVGNVRHLAMSASAKLPSQTV
ncbi:MAG: glycosyltransferase family 2 protein [Cyanobacteria bacterium J06621_11]